jgi:hypothetical protein
MGGSNRPAKLSWQNELERESMRAFDGYIAPWRPTWLDQRDDFGRDGVLQILDRTADGGVIGKPYSSFVQLKAHRAPFEDRHTEVFEVRHLQLWADDLAQPVLLVIWSKALDRFRVRSARQVVQELQKTNPDWGEQVSCTVEFRREHECSSSDVARHQLDRLIADEADRFGGVKAFHKAVRRVLLTELYSGRVNTSVLIQAGRPGREITCVEGPGWTDGDLDPAEREATRVLSNALLLFEEVWLPLQFIEVAMLVLGPATLRNALEQRYIIPYTFSTFVGFVFGGADRRGEVVTFNVIDPSGDAGPMGEALKRVKKRAKEMSKAGSITDFDEIIPRATEILTPESATPILEASRRDLRDPRIRKLLGLSAHKSDDTEPIWDCYLANRVTNINTALSIGTQRNIDVIDFEGGLSRLAAEKWYGELGFNRLFTSSEAFDRVLRSSGLPDVGAIAQQLTLQRVVDVARTTAGQDFRDWFWETASLLVASGGSASSSVIERLASAFGLDSRSVHLPAELKFRLCQQLRTDYIVGAIGFSSLRGFEARASDGTRRLTIQKEIHKKRKRKSILNTVGRLPGPYEPCICGAAAKFRFCCG